MNQSACCLPISLLLVGIFFFFFQLGASHSSCTFSESEYNTLRDFYDATRGPQWNCPNDLIFPGKIWNFSTALTTTQNPCQSNWQGVNCSYICTGNYQSPCSCAVQALALWSCGLVGALPESIYSIHGLQGIDFYDNYLNGTISPSIGNLLQLGYFQLNYNYFWGTLPKELYTLVNLDVLGLDNNNFSGTIADEIGNLTSLTTLHLEYNNFTGTISSEFAALINLEYCYATSNSFFGSLPNVTNFLPAIIQFEFDSNLLHGTIPHCFFGCHPNSQIQLVYLENNSFSGKIPNFVVSKNSTIEGFDIGLNYFSSSVYNANENLRVLVIEENQFSGVLPTMREVQYYIMDDNYFTGSLPTNITANVSHSASTYFMINSNFLTGFVETKLHQIPRIFNLSWNLFTGNLDSIVDFEICENNSASTYFDISNNMFTGTIPANWTTRILGLNSLDVSNNQLSGELPSTITASLQTFSASSNCLSGSLPVEWCQEDGSLESLFLNGLSTASNCQLRLFPHTAIPTYSIKSKFVGRIPSCFFNFPALRSLYLSGNSLTGTLPDFLQDNSFLSLPNLDLSYNALTGTIPLNFQHSNWTTLDLAYNFFTGSLSSSFASLLNDASLKLTGNRLSGNVPTRLLSAENINILDGNLFGCNFNSDLLPQNDPNVNNYSCGSDSANLQIYYWIFCFCLLFISLLFIWYSVVRKVDYRWAFINFSVEAFTRSFIYYNEFHSYCLLLYQRQQENQKENVILRDESLVHLWIFNYRARRTSFSATLYIFILLLPVYGVLSVYYSNYSNRYAWVLSPFYSSGQTMATIVAITFFSFVLFVVLLILFVWIFPFQNNYRLKLKTDQQVIQKKEKFQWIHFWNYSLVFFTTGAVILSANFLYVFVVLTSNTTAIFFTQIFVSSVQTVWNQVILWKLVTFGPLYLGKFFKMLKLYDQEIGKQENLKTRRTTNQYTNFDISFISFNLSLNALIYPMTALIIFSTDCFHNAFYQSQPVSYSYNSYNANPGNSEVSLYVSSSYNPPFVYSYQCSSFIYAYYCPVFIQSLLVDGILVPVYKLLKSYYFEYREENETKNQSGGPLQSKTDIELTSLNGSDMTTNVAAARSFSRSLSTVAGKVNKTGKSIFHTLREYLEEMLKDAEVTPNTPELFARNQYTIRLNYYLLILIAYGAVFPPLAFIVFAGIVSRTLYEEIVIGKLLYRAKENVADSWIKSKLDVDCQNIMYPMKYCLTISVPVSVVLYSFLVFDTYGKESSVVLALIPAFIFFTLSIALNLYLNFGSDYFWTGKPQVASNIDSSKVVYVENPLKNNKRDLV
jgi:hypothetical protein